MNKTPDKKIPTPDPANDILLFFLRESSVCAEIPGEDGTRLFAHPLPEGRHVFYLSYRDTLSATSVIRTFGSGLDAAAFILGIAGPQLAGIPGPERDRIHTCFPGFFDSKKTGSGHAEHPGNQDPCTLEPEENTRAETTGYKNDTVVPGAREQSFPETNGSKKDPAIPGTGEQSREDFHFRVPLLDPTTDTCLFRSLRHCLSTGRHHERGTDLFAYAGQGSDPADGQDPGPADPPVFYFRHWLWCDNGPGICEITSREEAALFIREQFTKPGLFSGWNHKGLYELLPEVYGKR
jgi:hypothetical protein